MTIAGVPYHLGIAVHDLDATIEQYQSLLGVRPWARREVNAPSTYRGRPTRHVTRMAMAPWGEAYLELVQPLSGDSPAAEFLRDRGEGAYHVGYFSEDLSGTGIDAPVFWEVRPDGDLAEVGAVYLDTLERMGLYVELVRATRADAFYQWSAPHPGWRRRRDGGMAAWRHGGAYFSELTLTQLRRGAKRRRP